MTLRRLVFLAVLFGPTLCAAQEEQYGEREVLDPETETWVARPAEEVTTPEGTLDRARQLLAQGKYRKAYKLLDKWTEENPDHERYLEGMYLLGEARFERSEFYQAYEAYEVVAENTYGELFYKSLRREMDVARAFLSGEKRIVWKLLRLSAYDEGIEILDRVWERVPGTRLGEAALKLKADYYYAIGDMDFAQDEYARLAQEYPAGRYTQFAMLRSAESAAAAFPGVKFDDRALLNADVRYRQVQSAFPVYARREHVPDRLDGIREQRAEKDLEVARWYERVKQPAAAEWYYRLILRDWPETLAASEAQQQLRALGVEPTEEEETQP